MSYAGLSRSCGQSSILNAMSRFVHYDAIRMSQGISALLLGVPSDGMMTTSVRTLHSLIHLSISAHGWLYSLMTWLAC